MLEKRSLDQIADTNQKILARYHHFNVVVTCRATSRCEWQRGCAAAWSLPAHITWSTYYSKQAQQGWEGWEGIVLLSPFQSEVINNFLVIRNKICPALRLYIAIGSKSLWRHLLSPRQRLSNISFWINSTDEILRMLKVMFFRNCMHLLFLVLLRA